MKTCPKCKIQKALKEGFYARSDKKGSGFQSWCKECVKAGRRAYIAENPERIKDQQLRMDFGITIEQYAQMFAEQDGKCAICDTQSENLSRGLCIDHDHQTRVIRGLLCTCCNTALGKFRDNPELLRRAIQYLDCAASKQDNEANVLILPRRGRRGGKTALQA